MWFRRRYTTQEHARDIMGENFFGIEESERFFGVNPSRWQLRRLSRIPFSEDFLNMCKDTHVLISVFPITIKEFYSKFGNTLFSCVSDHCIEDLYFIDHHKSELKKAVGETDWILLRKEPMFVGKPLADNLRELSLLYKNDEVPTLLSIVYCMSGYFLKTGSRLFEGVYVVSSDMDSDCYYFGVGFGDGICFGSYICHKSYNKVGLATARRKM